MNSLYEIVRICSIVSPVIGIALFFYLKVKNNPIINMLILFMMISLMSDVLSYVLSKFNLSSLLVVNAYFIIQLLMVGVIYVQLIPTHVKTIRMAIIVYVTITLLSVFIQQDFYAIQNLSWAFSTLLTMIITFTYFVQLGNSPVVDVQRHPSFWITVGIFFYGSFSLVILTLSQYFAQNHVIEDFRHVWIFHNANNIFKNVCFAAAIWWAMKREAESLSNHKAY
jgi:hypothetical protein